MVAPGMMGVGVAAIDPLDRPIATLGKIERPSVKSR